MVDQAFVWGGWRCCVTCLVRLIHFAFTLVWPLIAKWNRSNCLGIHHNWASFSNWQRDQRYFQRWTAKEGAPEPESNRWISSYTVKTLLTLVLSEWSETPQDEQWTVRNLSQRLVNRLDWKKKNVKKNHKKSRNRRPWYPRTTSKVNIQTFGWTKCTMCAMYCKKFQCFCSCFSLFCYYAHFSN